MKNSEAAKKRSKGRPIDQKESGQTDWLWEQTRSLIWQNSHHKHIHRTEGGAIKEAKGGVPALRHPIKKGRGSGNQREPGRNSQGEKYNKQN